MQILMVEVLMMSLDIMVHAGSPYFAEVQSVPCDGRLNVYSGRSGKPTQDIWFDS